MFTVFTSRAQCKEAGSPFIYLYVTHAQGKHGKHSAPQVGGKHLVSTFVWELAYPQRGARSIEVFIPALTAADVALISPSAVITPAFVSKPHTPAPDVIQRQLGELVFAGLIKDDACEWMCEYWYAWEPVDWRCRWLRHLWPQDAGDNWLREW